MTLNNKPKRFRTAHVVSDLHMFCRRSDWEEHIDALHESAEEADLFVFNGDTVDFKWSILPSVAATIDAAIEFLRNFAAKHPGTQIHVNLGNHDHIPAFMEALDKLAEETSNLSWHPYFLRVGSTLILHGDVANWKMNHNELMRYRSRWMHHKQQGNLKNRVYDMAFQARAHIAVSRLAFPHRRTAKRVAAYLEDIGHDAGSGIDQVCFGHTHVPVSGYNYGGVIYHNGGAPMKGIKFDLLKLDL